MYFKDEKHKMSFLNAMKESKTSYEDSRAISFLYLVTSITDDWEKYYDAENHKCKKDVLDEEKNSLTCMIEYAAYNLLIRYPIEGIDYKSENSDNEDDVVRRMVATAVGINYKFIDSSKAVDGEENGEHRDI